MKKLLKKKLRILKRKSRIAKRAVLMLQKKTVKKSNKFFNFILNLIKNFNFKIPHLNLSKVGAVVMAFGMIVQLAGITPTKTLAIFSDQENVSNNAITSASLDFILEDGAWGAYPNSGGLLPGDSVERLVKVKKLSGLDFQYKITALKVAGSASYCNALEIKALRENVELYNGSLLDLNIVPRAVIASDGTDDWRFVLTLPSTASEFPSLACEFNLEFYAWQQNFVTGGFNDTEILSNVVEGISSGPETDDFVQGISPIGDAYVDQNSDNNNYGGHHNLFVRSKKDNQGNPENRRTFVQFNLPIPPIATVTSASLKMRLTNAPGEDRTLEASRALSSWTENGIKWNNQPSASASVSGSVNMGNLNDVWKTWDVTSDVQSFVEGAEQNYGWRIKDSGEGSENSQESTFASREHSSEIYGPILEIALTAQAATTTHLVINEVYYNVGSAGVGNDTHNEWVEIYNPTDSAVDISGWRICDNSTCDIIPTSTPISAKGFAVITNKSSTWGYWSGIPSGAIKIELNSEIGSGLANTGDRVILKNPVEAIIDQMSYGSDNAVLNPAVPHSGNGRSVARIIKGYDNNIATDWVVNATPNPGTNPSENGEEYMRFTVQGMEIAKIANDLVPLIDNPTPRVEVILSENTELDCACSQTVLEPVVISEPEKVTSSGGGSPIVTKVEEGTAPEEEQSLVPEPETIPTEEIIVPTESAVTEDSVIEEPAPIVTPEVVSEPEELPVPTTESTPEEIQPEAPPVVIEPEIITPPAPTEEPAIGGGNE